MISRIKQLKPSERMQRLSFRTIPFEPKQADEHYRSPDHVEWSKVVLRRAGYACEKCGRDDGRLFADHVREIKDGGLLYDPMNGQALCGSCHTIKTLHERAKRR